MAAKTHQTKQYQKDIRHKSAYAIYMVKSIGLDIDIALRFTGLEETTSLRH